MADTGQVDSDITPRRPSYFDRHASSTAPPLPTSPIPSGTPGSPRTPLYSRSISGNLLNSPGSFFRTDDELHVLELGARYLRVGFGGEAQPRAVMHFGPDTARREGDYLAYLPGQEIEQLCKRRRRPREFEPGNWGLDHALFPIDLRGCELGLVSDKIMRAIRDAVRSHLLVIDDRRRGLVLAIPSLLPHPLLSTILQTLFSHFPNPQQITLLSSPLCATIAAGLRHALVVDLGYHETVVTAVAELKEVTSRRSDRAMRRLNWEVGKMLVGKLDQQTGSQSPGVAFEDCEEVIRRVCWCRTKSRKERELTEQEEDDSTIDVSLPSRNASEVLPIAFSMFSQPVESTFFAPSHPPLQPPDPSILTERTKPLTSTTVGRQSITISQSSSPIPQDPTPLSDDDHLTTLPSLLYQILLALPIDTRFHLLSRILITGGGSHIPNLKTRIRSDLTELIRIRGWDPVESYGSAASKPAPTRASVHIRRRTIQKPKGPVPVLKSTKSPLAQAETVEHDPTNKDTNPSSTTPAHAQPPLADPILARIHRSSPKSSPSHDSTRSTQAQTPEQPRLLTTLGAWSGASLLTGLRQRGLVEIERDSFLSYGLKGADRDRESTVQVEGEAQRRSREQENRRVSVLAGRVGGEDLARGEGRRSGSWTLGAWA